MVYAVGNQPKQISWISPVTSFKSLKTRSQRTLKKHCTSPIFSAIDAILYSYRFSSLFDFDGNGQSQLYSLPSFFGNGKTPLQCDSVSLVSSLVSIQVVESEGENEENNNREKSVLLLFDFEDTFRRHLLHAVAEFYHLVSFSRMCYHVDDEPCYCQRPKDSPVHRITAVHKRLNQPIKPSSYSSQSSSGSSSSNSFVFPVSETSPTSLGQFLSTYCVSEEQ